jgi:hypothetical protein
MGIKYINNSESTLDSGIGAAAVSLQVAAGEGIKFPVVDYVNDGCFFYATLVDVTGNREVIKVTKHLTGTDVFQTIVRAQDAIGVWNETPTAYAFSAGDKVQVRLPAAAIMAPDATKSTYFQVDSANTGPRIENESGDMAIKNATGAAYANLKALGLTLSGALALGGAITGATTGAFSSNVTIGGTLGVSGAITAAVASNIEIDNETDNRKIKARDHEATGAIAEVVNVIYGTGSPSAASGYPIGTIFIKYTT